MSTDKKKSETAFAILSLRALSNYETNVNIKTNDTLAELFLPDDRKKILADFNSREELKKTLPAGLYEYVISRTNYFDELFVKTLSNNIDQIVFLGAGYDSRPYRFKNLIKDTKIFETDSGSTQEYKLEILHNNKINIHENVSFVSVNFETDDFILLLQKCGYDKNKETLFICEGVTFYLSGKTVISMLEKIRKNSGAGSKLGFDFQTIVTRGDLIDTGLKDEKIKFGISHGEIEKFVLENQFVITEHLSSADMEKRFLTSENGDLSGHILPIMNILLIENK